MTPKEAIFEIERKLNTTMFRIGAEYIREELELLKKTLTPPTADEVCKALSKELEAFEVLEKLYIEAPFNCEIDGEHVTNIVKKALTELEELKSWRDELNETIQYLISKAKHWEEKENKTDFEKGIARGYKTMLHQLLVGIDFDKESD